MRSFLRRFSSLVTIASIALAAPAHAQTLASAPPRDSVKVALLRQLIKQTRAVDLAVTAMEASLPAQRAANPRIPAVFWDRFMSLAHDRVGDLENVMIAAYDRHFTNDELRQLLAFYQSPVGRKFLAEQPAIVRESMVAGQEWGQRIGIDVAQQLAAEGIKIQP